MPEAPRTLNPETRRALAHRIEFYREMGIHDFYRRTPESRVAEAAAAGDPPDLTTEPVMSSTKPASHYQPAEHDPVVVASPDTSSLFDADKPEARANDPVQALRLIREDLGDCTRCKLHQQGRKQIVFGVGNPRAELMFVGEGPGADEDEQGEPFVGRAGQLLNKMIAAMGMKREDVYIANVVKCRPPGNRTPERDECDTCSPFLLRQIAAIRPKVIVALGAVSAKNLLAINASMGDLRGKWYDFRGSKLAVTYHPAYLLRDPRQKGEAWKDLQRVMKELGMPVPAKSSAPE